MKTLKQVISEIEDITSRTDLPPVCLEMEEIGMLEDAIIYLKKYAVLKNRVKETEIS